MSDTVSAGTGADTVTAAPAAPAAPAQSWTEWMAGKVAVIDSALAKGAATIYHDVLAIEGTVTAWTSNPAVANLITTVALPYAEAYAAKLGIPAGSIALVAGDVMAALKTLAALDQTVTSVAPAAPAAAPSVAGGAA